MSAWGWPQWVTLLTAIVGVVLQFIVALVSEAKAGTSAVFIMLVAWGQWVLWMGGYYS